MQYNSTFSIGDTSIGIHEPTYFIADIASNHDGDLERAKQLIWLSKEAGANAVKFQHFKAEKIVSDYGFKHLQQGSHQASWEKSVFEVFKDYEFNRNWNDVLQQEAKKADIEFFTTPYDFEAVESVDHLVNAYKIGSGDITWTDFILHTSLKNKPMLLASGASNFQDVQRAVNTVLEVNPNIALMQCNTNYTGSLENFKYINLNVLKTFATMYPNMVLGLSDHTPGHSTVLGAITLGARLIEKHFTDNNERIGPDHAFSMNPTTWRDMVERSRELEYALGDGVKKVEGNEQETVVVQRRGIYLTVDKKAGETIEESDLDYLRPATPTMYVPYEKAEVLGKKLLIDKQKAAPLNRGDLL